MQKTTGPGHSAGTLEIGIARSCSIGVMVLSALVLCGWLLGVPWLVTLGRQNGSAMAPNTALSLLAAGLALRLLLIPAPSVRRIAWLPASIPAVLGVATLIEYFVPVDLGIDQALVADRLGLVETGFAGRMASLTALGLTLTGTALLLDCTRVRLAIAQWLCLPLLVLALFALFGLGFDAERLQLRSGATGIALPTVVALLALAIGILCARPGQGPGAILGAAGAGGMLARRMIPVAMLLPPTLAWLLLRGAEQGRYGIEGFAALTATLTFLLLAGFSWWLARELEERHLVQLVAAERLRRSEAMLDQAQEVSHVGGWQIDPASGRIDWTREVFRIHQVPPDFDQNNLERSLAFYTEADRPILAAAIAAACSQGTPWDLELQFLTAKGQLRWVRSSGQALREDGRVVRVHGFITDITERKKTDLALHEAHAALSEANARLEQRVAERTERLEAAIRDSESFAYAVAHDLRAPLRSIDGFTRILEEDYAPQMDDEGKDTLHRVRANAQKMALLIDELLKLSRLSRAEINPEPVDLAELARSIAAALQAAEPARRVSFDIVPSAPAQGDRRLLTVVLENLLGNAWKFSSKHATAKIAFGRGSVEGVPMYFVRDDGAGFDMAHVGNLFVPFQRLHGTGEFPGSGIGLSIVQGIVQRHGGRVWAEGAVEQGATFYFTLRADGPPVSPRLSAAA